MDTRASGRNGRRGIAAGLGAALTGDLFRGRVGSRVSADGYMQDWFFLDLFGLINTFPSVILIDTIVFFESFDLLELDLFHVDQKYGDRSMIIHPQMKPGQSQGKGGTAGS